MSNNVHMDCPVSSRREVIAKGNYSLDDTHDDVCRIDQTQGFAKGDAGDWIFSCKSK